VFFVLLALVIAIGCSQELDQVSVPDASTEVIWTIDNIQEFQLPAAKDAGELHNEYLDLMYSTDPEGPLTLAGVPVFEEMFTEHGIPTSVIPEVLESSASLFDGLIGNNLLSFPTATTFDPDGIANYLIDIGSFQNTDRAELSDFLNDLASTLDEKSSNYDAMIQKWQSKEKAQTNSGIGYAVSVLAGSSNYWSQKHEPSPNKDIVAYDVVGGLVGFFFGGVGSIIGAGISSYAAAIYCEDVGDH